MLGMGIIAFNMHDGMIILDNAQKLGESVNGVAKHNKTFRDTLVKLMQVSIYGALITSHATVAIAIMQNHDMLPSIGNPLVEKTYQDVDVEDQIKYMKEHPEEFMI